MFFAERLNKKGVGTILTGLIILLFVVAVLWVFIGGSFASWLDVMQGRATCQTWVDIQSSSLGKAPIIGYRYTDYESPCETRVEKINVKDENKLYQEMADRMYTCLSEYRFGKRNFYSDYTLDWTKTYCRFCNEVYIDSKDVKDFDWNEFQIYLNTKKPRGDTRTYAVIFTDTTDATVEFGGVEKTPIDAGKPFYIVFTIDDYASWGERLAEAAGFALPVGGYSAYRSIKQSGGFVKGVKVIFRNIADVAAVRKADDSFRYVHLLESGASSAAMKPGYGSAFGGVVKGIKKNVIITIAGSAIVATTYKSFKPGVAIMTGEEVIENSDCDLDSIYMNPVIKDKDIESKLATYRKEKENEQKK